MNPPPKNGRAPEVMLGGGLRGSLHESLSRCASGKKTNARWVFEVKFGNARLWGRSDRFSAFLFLFEATPLRLVPTVTLTDGRLVPTVTPTGGRLVPTVTLTNGRFGCCPVCVEKRRKFETPSNARLAFRRTGFLLWGGVNGGVSVKRVGNALAVTRVTQANTRQTPRCQKGNGGRP